MAIEFINSILLAIHLLMVNIASAAPIFCIYLERRASRSDDFANRLGIQIAKTAVAMLVFGSILGLTIGLLGWLQGRTLYVEVLPRFSWKILWGIAEIFFSLICMGIYIAMWRQTVRERRHVFLHRTLAVLAASNLLYHFPPLFGVMTYVAENANQFENSISVSVFRGLAYSQNVFPMTVHFCLAAFSVSGIFVMARAKALKSTSEADEESCRSIYRGSARVALAATAFQVIVGTWVLLSTDPWQQHQLLGGNLFATTALLTSVLLTFGLGHLLGTASFGIPDAPTVRRLISIVVLIVFLMTLAQRSSRQPPEGASNIGPTEMSDREALAARSYLRFGAGCSTTSLPSAFTMRTTLS